MVACLENHSAVWSRRSEGPAGKMEGVKLITHLTKKLYLQDLGGVGRSSRIVKES